MSPATGSGWASASLEDSETAADHCGQERRPLRAMSLGGMFVRPVAARPQIRFLKVPRVALGAPPTAGGRSSVTIMGQASPGQATGGTSDSHRLARWPGPPVPQAILLPQGCHERAYHWSRTGTAARLGRHSGAGAVRPTAGAFCRGAAPAPGQRRCNSALLIAGWRQPRCSGPALPAGRAPSHPCCLD